MPLRGLILSGLVSLAWVGIVVGVLAGCGRTGRRLAVAIILACSVLSAPPAEAATVRMSAAVVPATIQVHAVAVVSGVVSTHKAGVSVVLQRRVGTLWQPLARATTGKAGGFTVSVRAAGKPVVWSLRAVVPGAVSRTLTVRVVKSRFVVHASPAAASVEAGQPWLITGGVAPKAKGGVLLQLRSGSRWLTVSSARLTAKSRFTLRLTRPVGSYTLRVAKAFSATVAAGVSSSIKLAVTSPPPPPPALAVTTTSLPSATAGLPYTAALAAAGGLPPYTWGVPIGTLPPGLVLSAEGDLSGTPTAAGSVVLSLTVADARGTSATRAIGLTVALSPYAAQRVMAWGRGAHGYLGNGGTADSSVPVAVSGLAGVTAVAATAVGGYALRFDGTVWAWGYGTGGELGNAGTLESDVPVQVSGLTQVTAIAGGALTGYALRSDGSLWAWGFNGNGEIGDGTTTNRLVPVQVLSQVTGISAGGGGTAFALRADGTVWAWGFNGNGALGDGTLTTRWAPVLVSGLSGVTTIASGYGMSFALRSDGSVAGWGSNGYGQLGTGQVGSSTIPVPVVSLSGVSALAAGYESGYAVRAGGTVWAWGRNDVGQLGTSTVTTVNATPLQVASLAGVTSLAGGSFCGYALSGTGVVSAWGGNTYGQLGDGDLVDSTAPVAVSGLTHVLAVASSPSSNTAYALMAG